MTDQRITLTARNENRNMGNEDVTWNGNTQNLTNLSHSNQGLPDEFSATVKLSQRYRWRINVATVEFTSIKPRQNTVMRLESQKLTNNGEWYV